VTHGNKRDLAAIGRRSNTRSRACSADTFVNGVAGISEIAPGVVRLTSYQEYEETDGDSARERKIVESSTFARAQGSNVEGQLQTKKWQDQQGQDRYSTEVLLQGFNSQLVMLDRAPNDPVSSDSRAMASESWAVPSQARSAVRDDLNDEVPF
jgi:hypothetical protein